MCPICEKRKINFYYTFNPYYYCTSKSSILPAPTHEKGRGEKGEREGERKRRRRRGIIFFSVFLFILTVGGRRSITKGGERGKRIYSAGQENETRLGRSIFMEHA